MKNLFPSPKSLKRCLSLRRITYITCIVTLLGTFINWSSSITTWFVGHPPTVEEQKILKSEKPKVVIDGLQFTKWIGDEEPFLTINFTNPTHYDALNVSSNLLHRDRFNRFSKTKTSTVFQSGNVMIEAGKSLSVPLAPLSELQNYALKYAGSMKIVGVGSEANLPKLAEGFQGYMCRRSLGIPIKFTYKNIFGATTTTSSTVYLYIDVT